MTISNPETQTGSAPAQPVALAVQAGELPQWHLLASPGHALLAQVDAWRHLSKRYLAIALIGLVLMVAYVYVMPSLTASLMRPITSMGTSLASGLYSLATSDADGPQAVALPMPTDIVPARVEDPASWEATHLPLAVLPAGLTEAARRFAAGETVECVRETRLGERFTQPATAASPVSCKAGADQSRLWLWGAGYTPARASWERPGFFPFLVVLRKAEDGAVTAYSLPVGHRAGNSIFNATTTIPGIERIDADRIRRALAADFPELTTKGAEK